MPSSIRRWSPNLLPRLPSSEGITDSTAAQNSSEITPIRVTGQSSLVNTFPFGRHALVDERQQSEIHDHLQGPREEQPTRNNKIVPITRGYSSIHSSAAREIAALRSGTCSLLAEAASKWSKWSLAMARNSLQTSERSRTVLKPDFYQASAHVGRGFW